MKAKCDVGNDIIVTIGGRLHRFHFERDIISPESKTNDEGDGLDTEKPFYWVGADPIDGSIFGYIRDSADPRRIHGSLVDVTEGTVTRFGLDAKGGQVVVTRSSDDF
jgi:hypothetical protein